jgi:hypothetical protein
MRSTPILLACAASAAAKMNSRSPGKDLGVCLAGLAFGDPVCAQGTADTHQGVFISGETSSQWTESSPCFRNGTNEYCLHHSSTFARGKGMSILTGSKRAAHVANSLAFSKPEEALEGRNKPSPKWNVVPIAGKEYGVVAKETIYRGERVISETPTIMVDYGAFDDIPQEELYKLQGQGIDYLNDQHRGRFLNMSTHGQKGDHLATIEKILVTNAFDIDLDDDEEESFYAIFAESTL